jgi:hypothetical protein
MNRLDRYEYWLSRTSMYFGVEENEITKRGGSTKFFIAEARQTFYWLCWRDKIDLYRLSEHLGKHRTTVVTTMNKSFKRRNKEAEENIWKIHEENI